MRSLLRARSPSSAGRPLPPGLGWQAAAGALMIGGPVWHYLHVNHYRAGDPGGLLVPGVAAVLGALGAILARRFPGGWAILPFAGLALGFIDLQFDFEETVSTAAVAAAVFVIVAALGGQRERIVVMALAAFYLSSIPQGVPTSTRLAAGIGPPPNRSQPFLLHLILDAHWGVGGLREAGDTATAAWLADFYQDRGFRVYSGAYSRTYLTRFSIAETFSLGAPVGIAEPAESEYRLEDNPYFTELDRLGYRVSVVQSTYLDVCPERHPAIESCVSAPWRSIANVGYLQGSWGARTAMVARFILNSNSHLYRRIVDRDGGRWRKSAAGRAAADIDSLAREIRQQAGPGIAMVAHVVLPHGPFEVDEHCLMHADPSRRLGEEPPTKVAVDTRWPERLAAYNRQMRCAQSKVAALIAAVDSSVGAANAIVIVQGDHGARIAQHPIPRTEGLATFSVEQLNAAFSTLFAIRAPGVGTGGEDAAVPVQQWFWKFVAKGFRAPPDPTAWEHYVRRPPTNNVSGDTLRILAADEMVWAKPGARTTDVLTAK